MKRIYEEYLHGYSTQEIARRLTREGIENGNHRTKWYDSNIQQILSNEKYKGDALLQKTYTVDFLNKTRIKNNGQVPQYYVEDSHEAIIDKEKWECVQLEMRRRKEYMQEHGIRQYQCNPDSPFAGRVICGNCGKAYGRKVWNYYGEDGSRYVWQCTERYKIKGVIGCDSGHVDEEKLKQALVKAYNSLIDKKKNGQNTQEILNGEDLLIKYRHADIRNIIKMTSKIEDADTDIVFRMLDHITVLKHGKILVLFLDGREIEYIK